MSSKPAARLASKMSSQIQTYVALAVVALAATGLVLRAIAKRKHPGCGSECGGEAEASAAASEWRSPAREASIRSSASLGSPWLACDSSDGGIA